MMIPGLSSAAGDLAIARADAERAKAKRAEEAKFNQSGLIPVEFYVVVAIDPAETKTAGGIILPSQVQEKDALATQEGTLVAVSPHAFSYVDHWPEGTKPEPGMRVLFKKYAGTGGGVYKRTVDGVEREFRLMPDKDIAAIIETQAKDANHERPEAQAAVDDSGYSNLPGGVWIRCMGGRFCDHAPGTCTADPAYQAMIRKAEEAA